MPSINPYIIGNWVKGDDHYGRVNIIDRILKGKDKHLWILATRRAGKTSLLQHVANLIVTEPERYHLVPLFWNMEGCSDSKMLARAIAYSIRILQRKYKDIYFTDDELKNFDLFELLEELALKVMDRSKELLLLCDEPEALLITFENDPNGLSKLRGCLQREGMRSVLVSSLHLFELDSIPTIFDRFLDGFAQIGLNNLNWENALNLIHQSQNTDLQADFQPPNEEECKDIFDKTNGNPFLIQWACQLWFETRDLGVAYKEMLDKLPTYFNKDYQTLAEKERKIFDAVIKGNHSVSQLNREFTDFPLELYLKRIETVSLLKRSDDKLELGNWFLKKIFEGKSPAPVTTVSKVSPKAALEIEKIGPIDIQRDPRIILEPAIFRIVAEGYRDPYSSKPAQQCEENTFGTGFFITPDGWALTCWHVVYPSFGTWPEGKVLVDYNGEILELELHTYNSCPGHDLAVLKLKTEQRDVEYVPLLMHWQAGDQTYTLGFQEQSEYSKAIAVNAFIPPGNPTVWVHFENELSQECINLVFADIGFRPGMSGAPILNCRTSRVFAIETGYRPGYIDEQWLLKEHGYGIPLKYLYCSWHGFEKICPPANTETTARPY